MFSNICGLYPLNSNKNPCLAGTAKTISSFADYSLEGTLIQVEEPHFRVLGGPPQMPRALRTPSPSPEHRKNAACPPARPLDIRRETETEASYRGPRPDLRAPLLLCA